MGIYLPNIEMPRKGEMLVIFPDGTSYVCFNGMRERLKQTTPFPVPPHGRLVDADALREDWLENGENEYVYDTNAFLDSLDDAPTVIPAEPAEEGE